MRCKNCGAELPEGARFCYMCAAPVADAELAADADGRGAVTAEVAADESGEASADGLDDCEFDDDEPTGVISEGPVAEGAGAEVEAGLESEADAEPAAEPAVETAKQAEAVADGGEKRSEPEELLSSAGAESAGEDDLNADVIPPVVTLEAPLSVGAVPFVPMAQAPRGGYLPRRGAKPVRPSARPGVNSAPTAASGYALDSWAREAAAPKVAGFAESVEPVEPRGAKEPSPEVQEAVNAFETLRSRLTQAAASFGRAGKKPADGAETRAASAEPAPEAEPEAVPVREPAPEPEPEDTRESEAVAEPEAAPMPAETTAPEPETLDEYPAYEPVSDDEYEQASTKPAIPAPAADAEPQPMPAFESEAPAYQPFAAETPSFDEPAAAEHVEPSAAPAGDTFTNLFAEEPVERVEQPAYSTESNPYEDAAFEDDPYEDDADATSSLRFSQPVTGPTHFAAGAARRESKVSPKLVGGIAAAALVVVVGGAALATGGFGLASNTATPQVPAQEEATEQEGASDSQAKADAAQPSAESIAVKASVNDYSWDELSQISALISAASDDADGLSVAKKYNLVGATGVLDGTQSKEVELSDGTVVNMRIIGFRQDQRSDGNGLAGITFWADAPIATLAMNESGAVDWSQTSLRAWLNSEGEALLPGELASKIVEVRKQTNLETDFSSQETTDEKLWLLSYSELCGTVTTGSYRFGMYNDEGVQYRLFVDNGITWQSIDPMIAVGDTANWWTRSPDPLTPGLYIAPRNSDGAPGYGRAASISGEVGVVPAFCL